jgi:hypothetical protein
MPQDVCPIVTGEDRARLEAIVADRSRPQKHVLRAGSAEKKVSQEEKVSDRRKRCQEPFAVIREKSQEKVKKRCQEPFAANHFAHNRTVLAAGRQ